MSKAEIARAAKAERERRQASLFDQKIRKGEIARRNKIEVAARAQRTAAKRQEKEDRKLLFEQREHLRLNAPEVLAQQYEEMAVMAKRQYKLFRGEYRIALSLADRSEDCELERNRMKEAQNAYSSLHISAVRYRKAANEHFENQIETLAKEASVTPTIFL
jgi:cellobiose-specific phosphotransferase system component IIB